MHHFFTTESTAPPAILFLLLSQKIHSKLIKKPLRTFLILISYNYQKP